MKAVSISVRFSSNSRYLIPRTEQILKFHRGEILWSHPHQGLHHHRAPDRQLLPALPGQPQPQGWLRGPHIEGRCQRRRPGAATSERPDRRGMRATGCADQVARSAVSVGTQMPPAVDGLSGAGQRLDKHQPHRRLVHDTFKAHLGAMRCTADHRRVCRQHRL